jgi:hypothetical protein
VAQASIVDLLEVNRGRETAGQRLEVSLVEPYGVVETVGQQSPVGEAGATVVEGL